MLGFKQNYKFVLTEDFSVQTKLTPSVEGVVPSFIVLSKDGMLNISRGYAWDGATGAIDSKSIIRGSLVHDALYQLIREGHLDKSFRKQADETLRDLCIEDGMSKFRATYVYAAVRFFGGHFI